MDKASYYDITQNNTLIKFSGQDAESFLQGQTTCNVKELTNINSTFAALCNPKGRVITLFHLYKQDDSYLMLLTNELAENIIKRLKMFVFRSKVKIENISPQHVIIARVAHSADPCEDASFFTRALTFNTTSNIQYLIATQEQRQLLEQDSSHQLETDLTEWNHALISACIPNISTVTTEKFIPQMLNLELLAGISFNKGCYTGQEVIARLHYKGQVKKRLFYFQSEQTFEDGEELYIEGDENSIGTVIDFAPSPQNYHEGLIVLKTALGDKENIILKDNSILNIKKPPYGLDLII